MDKSEQEISLDNVPSLEQNPLNSPLRSPFFSPPPAKGRRSPSFTIAEKKVYRSILSEIDSPTSLDSANNKENKHGRASDPIDEKDEELPKEKKLKTAIEQHVDTVLTCK